MSQDLENRPIVPREGTNMTQDPVFDPCQLSKVTSSALVDEQKLDLSEGLEHFLSGQFVHDTKEPKNHFNGEVPDFRLDRFINDEAEVESDIEASEDEILNSDEESSDLKELVDDQSVPHDNEQGHHFYL